jgi:hypothetical protein
VGFTLLSAFVFTLYYRRHPLIRAGHIPSALPQGRAIKDELARIDPAPSSS